MKKHGIKNKGVVITGASSGIGEATAVMLAERGAKVVLGARGLDRLQSLARRIERAGGGDAYSATDVRKREDLTSLVNLACERYGQLDVLINNAGIGPISPLDDLRVEDWENMIDIEVFSTASPQRCRCLVSRVSDISSSTAGITVNPNMAV